MLRVRLFAVAMIALGAALAGCSSSGSTSDMFKSSPPPAQVIQFQSVPAGANVQTAQGQTCSTPCSLAVPVTGQAVSFSLNGYVPQTIQLAVHQAEGSWFSKPPPDLVPNPVVAALQVLPPPAPPPRKVEAEAAHDGRSAQACGAEAGIDAGADRAVHCRPGASAAARQCVPASATNVGIAVPATAGDAITPGKTRRARRFREKFWTIRALSGTLG